MNTLFDTIDNSRPLLIFLTLFCSLVVLINTFGKDIIHSFLMLGSTARLEAKYLDTEVESYLINIKETRNLPELIDIEETLIVFKLLYSRIFGYDNALRAIKKALWDKKAELNRERVI